MKAVQLFKSGELTPEGNPILIHFGPGVTIEPHERSAETKTIVTLHGVKHTVKGHYKEIMEKAGYTAELKKDGVKPAEIGKKGAAGAASEGSPIGDI